MVMMRIDRDLRAANWPEQKPIESIEFQSGDVLLVCGGFEDRVMTVLDKAASSKSCGLTVLNFEYAPTVESNHFEQVSMICEDAGWKHIRIGYDRCNPSGIFDNVAKQLPSDVRRLYIDISGMSRLLIVQLIAGLIEHKNNMPTVSILYTEAVTYPPTEAEAREKLASRTHDSSAIFSFISIGVYDLAIVPELSSSDINRAPTRLIAFPSFNPAQLFSVKSIIQPAKTTLIHGVPAEPALRWRTEVISQLNLINDDVVDQSLSISTLDYSECLSILLELYDEWSEFNSLVLSPTGSKMQTVAVGIFRGFVRDIQIVYPTPLRFTDPTDHTHGAKQVYELKLDSFISLRNDFSAAALITQ
ncbi:MAG: hypothetical protein A2Z94_02625 [Gallionellales bacterium GWA2_55_18]|nr:MAG: hypothetical protein A2Z94_02625 [Gallionellales bacterium GWA2_55_18]